MVHREALARRFARGDTWFDSSPLYRVLSRTVVTDDRLLELATALDAVAKDPPTILPETLADDIPLVVFQFHQRAPLLALRDSRGPQRDLALVEGHGRWMQPLT